MAVLAIPGSTVRRSEYGPCGSGRHEHSIAVCDTSQIGDIREGLRSPTESIVGSQNEAAYVTATATDCYEATIRISAVEESWLRTSVARNPIRPVTGFQHAASAPNGEKFASPMSDALEGGKYIGGPERPKLAIVGRVDGRRIAHGNKQSVSKT